MTETIDMTPTFEVATAIAVAIIQHAAETKRPSAELLRARDNAIAELGRYARELDRLKAAQENTDNG